MHRHLIALACLVAASTVARGETLQCTTITSVPYTIATPGNYCLTANLASTVSGTAAAITITADNVLLDLNDHQLSGPGGATAGYGIYAIDHRGLRVRNGLLRGFSRGVYFNDSYSGFPPHPSGLSSRHEIERLRVEGGTMGIWLLGRYSSVRDNVVVDASQIGIYAIGPMVDANGGGVSVLRNQVLDTIAASGSTAPVYGIFAGGAIQDNLVSNLRGTTYSAAIYASGSYGIVSRNREIDYGDVANVYAVYCGTTTIVVEGNLSSSSYSSGIPLMGNCNYQ